MIARYTDYMYSYPHKTAYRPFARPVRLQPYLEALRGRTASLYFHLPFCRSKCGYCNLFSIPAHRGEAIDRYLRALHRQAEQLAPLTSGLHFDSFAMGGGTPLLLEPEQLDVLFSLAGHFHAHPKDVFASIETSPEYADPARLEVLKRAGTTRISIGIQSFNDGELRALGRHPKGDSIYPALERIRRTDFPVFNLDLIYGIEGQTPQSLLHSLKEAMRFAPDEMFIYPLYVRYGTGIKARESDDACYRLYLTARDFLLQQGYRQTSMRRFVRHSLTAECSCGDEVMLSCGAGGRSYLGPLHYATPYAVHPSRIKEVIAGYDDTADFTTAANGFLLSPDEQRRRYLIKNLLYHMGINKEEYRSRFQQDMEAETLIGRLIDRQWVEDTAGRIRLTIEGMGYSDYIGQLFISPEVRSLMRSYTY